MAGCNRVGAEEISPASIRLRVEYAEVDGEPSLLMELRNSSNEPLSTYEAWLPWQPQADLTLVAVMARDASKIVQQVFPLFDDRSGRTVTLNPGATLRGTRWLLQNFPNFREAVSSGDVLLFWSYSFRTSAGSSQASKVYGGLTISVRGPDSRHEP
jgi:hypothetical protein